MNVDEPFIEPGWLDLFNYAIRNVKTTHNSNCAQNRFLTLVLIRIFITIIMV